MRSYGCLARIDPCAASHSRRWDVSFEFCFQHRHSQLLSVWLHTACSKDPRTACGSSACLCLAVYIVMCSVAQSTPQHVTEAPQKRHGNKAQRQRLAGRALLIISRRRTAIPARGVGRRLHLQLQMQLTFVADFRKHADYQGFSFCELCGLAQSIFRCEKAAIFRIGAFQPTKLTFQVDTKFSVKLATARSYPAALTARPYEDSAQYGHIWCSCLGYRRLIDRGPGPGSRVDDRIVNLGLLWYSCPTKPGWRWFAILAAGAILQSGYPQSVTRSHLRIKKFAAATFWVPGLSRPVGDASKCAISHNRQDPGHS